MARIKYTKRTITPHWLRVRHPESDRQFMRSKLVDLYGEPDRVRGRWFYEHGERFSNGILLMWGSIVNAPDDGSDDDPGHFCIDVPGGALDSMDGPDRIPFLRSIILGGRITRFDLAVDAHHDDGVGMIDLAIDALQGGHHTGSKTWEPKIKYKSGEIIAYGVNIGQRGKLGSGRYVRIYDKGLEQKDAPMGTHERFEVEFTKEAAHEAAIDVLDSEQGWEKRAWNRVNGAISFRRASTGNDRHLDRRPLLGWWAAWIDGTAPIATIIRHQPTTLDRYTNWLRTTVLPTCAYLANQARLSVNQTINALVGDTVKPRTEDRHMRTLVQHFRQAMAPDHGGGVLA